jgi:hypothetical protein
MSSNQYLRLSNSLSRNRSGEHYITLYGIFIYSVASLSLAMQFFISFPSSSKYWLTHSRFPLRVMRFLQANIGSIDAAAVADAATPSSDAKADELFGLELAGSKHCVLATEHVPAAMGWRIVTYDGKESVEYDWGGSDCERGTINEYEEEGSLW